MLITNTKSSAEIKFPFFFLLLENSTMYFEVIKILITCRNIFIRGLTEIKLKLISMNTLEL